MKSQFSAFVSLSRVWIFVLIAAFSFAACKQKDEQAANAKKKEVNLAIWSNFVTPEMLQTFQEKTGLKVNVSNYSSNEELLAKLQAGAAGIDVAVPSDYMVFAMSHLGLLEKIDRARIASFAHLNPQLLGREFDPENAYSMPWDWGTTGMAIRTDLFAGTVEGWNDLFNNPQLAGKFTLLDDVRETLGVALKASGYSLNSTNPAEIEKAQKALERARKAVKAFTSETLVGLEHGEMAVAHAYSSDALQAQLRTGGKVKYQIPEEGCTLWIDTLVIPRGAQNVEGAYELINFLLDAPIQSERAKNIRVAPSHVKAVELLPPDLKSNEGIFPSDAALSKCETIKDVGEKLTNYDRAWTALKASAQ